MLFLLGCKCFLEITQNTMESHGGFEHTRTLMLNKLFRIMDIEFGLGPMWRY